VNRSAVPTSARSFVGFVAGIPGLLRRPLTLDDTLRIVRDRLARREENFLLTAEELIYANPRSPFRRLLELAGCELGDLRVMVRADGIERALGKLRAEGVYVSFEEFKGRAPLVRGGREIDVRPSDFANPRQRRAIRSLSGGSTGPATQVARDLMQIERDALVRVLTYWAHGVLDAPTASWRLGLPSHEGVGQLLEDAKHRQIHERWFSPPSAFGFPASARNRLAEELMFAAARVAGVRLPRREVVDYDRADVIARWASDALRREGRALMRANVSQSVRIALAAREHGLDLTGLVFVAGAEPATPTKARAIAESGARHTPVYGSSEIGKLGGGCAAANSSNDSHFFSHTHAVIQHRRTTAAGTHDALLFTTLTPDGPTVLLNADSDDYGVVETRSCGCRFEEVGLTLHIRDVFSFSKLSGDGVTMVADDLFRVIEDVLPARFGGSMFDYQFVEEEDERGFTRLTVLVSPHIDIGDEADVVQTVLNSLGSTKLATEVAHIWGSTAAVRVQRTRPRIVGRGKHELLVRSSLRREP